MTTPITILTNAQNYQGEPALMTKVHTRTGDGWTTRQYDKALTFDAIVEHIDDIDGLSELLTLLEKAAHCCIVRGQPIGSTKHIRRRLCDDGPHKATLRDNPDGIEWVMLDFDKVPVASLGLDDTPSRLAYLVSLLPAEFHGVTYHYQWSSSAGVKGWDTLSCHLWYYLDQPWYCRDLHERFQTGDFRDVDVDAAPFTTNQVHYTASPIFVGADDPVTDRSGLVRGTSDVVHLSAWSKPVPQPPAPSWSRTGQSSGATFDQLLAEIGPNFHRPILRAAAHYVAVTRDFDADYLTQRICEAIHEAPHGRNSKSDYLDAAYLTRVIKGAASKFGGAA